LPRPNPRETGAAIILGEILNQTIALWAEKPEVESDKLHPTLKEAITLLSLLWAGTFPEDKDGMVITSGHEGHSTDPKPPRVHVVRSRHYLENGAGEGHAIDIRLNDVSQQKAAVFLSIVWMSLVMNFGDIWQIYPESILTPNAHLHVGLRQ